LARYLASLLEMLSRAKRIIVSMLGCSHYIFLKKYYITYILELADCHPFLEYGENIEKLHTALWVIS
jgi:hypothetical protein